MNEDQLADILTQHLDALLEDSPLPEELPAELAELLAVAQNLTGAAPAPRPEFGLALKESLLVPPSGGPGPVDPTPAGSAFNSHLILIIGLSLAGLALVLSLLIGAIIFGVTSSAIFGSPAGTPGPTEVIPTPSRPAPTATTPSPAPTATVTQPGPTGSPGSTATPILDVLPAITVTIEITIEPPALVPGGGGGGGGSGNGGGGGGDHDKGHGNDPDHDDEDNPGKGGDD